MSLESAWARLMRYCDGEEVYSAIAHADQVREHLRTDIMAVNDARLEQLAAAERLNGDAASVLRLVVNTAVKEGEAIAIIFRPQMWGFIKGVLKRLDAA